MSTMEQQARDLFERMGYQRSQDLSAGDVTEVANLLSCQHCVRRVRDEMREVVGGRYCVTASDFRDVIANWVTFLDLALPPSIGDERPER